MIVLEYITLGIGIIGVAVVIWGVIKGLVALLIAAFSGFGAADKSDRLEGRARLSIGFNLVGLEFLIAADTIRPTVEPTLE